MGSRENKRKGSGTENIELETILPVKWFFCKRRRDMGLLEDVGILWIIDELEVEFTY